MRILHVINSCDPRGGGPIESIRQACGQLQRRGHDCTVICADEPGSQWLESPPEVEVHALGPAYTRYRLTFRFGRWLHAHAGEYQVAVIHGLWLYPDHNAGRILRKQGVPYFIYTHGLLDPALKSLFPVRGMIKAVSWRLFDRRLLAGSAGVFFTCREEERLAREAFAPFPARGYVVPYCVADPGTDRSRDIEKFLAAFPACRGKRCLLFLSRIHVKKGCDILLKAFAQVFGDSASEHHLIMAGPDSMGWRSELEGLSRELGIAEHVTWTGMLRGALKWGAFGVAEAFVLPSHQENFGIAVVESLACGVPVLITRRVNIWREIEEDGAGIATEDDESAFAGVLSAWSTKSADERRMMRRKARDCYQRRFHPERAAAHLIETMRAAGVEVDA